jgi:electron transport complex protein RnfB
MPRSLKEPDIFRKLQEHLNKMPIGFPKAESGSDIRVLKHLFTPEEAAIALTLNFGWERDLEPLEQICERAEFMGISTQDLEQKLDDMAKKGSITRRREGDKKFYGNAPLVVGMYEYQVDKLTNRFLKDLDSYFGEAWGIKANPTNFQQLRIIPVDISVQPDNTIAPYDNIKEIVEISKGPFAKINCICRQHMKLEGRPCKMTRHESNCLAFGNMAQNYIDQGWGTQISKEETLKILHQNQDEGLIFRPNNAQYIDFVCSCCNCCDGTIGNLSKLPNPADFVTSNYYAEVDSDSCIGCGVCMEFCQMHAIELREDIAVVNRTRCIGCGNCSAKCSSEAILLKKKEKQYIPPRTMDDLFDMILEEKTKLNK